MIENWGQMYPYMNIGVATGAESNLVVVDLDEGGWESFKKLEQRHGKVPPTVTAQTGSGGYHLYFSYPEYRKIGNGVKVQPGIDVRGEGGQVVIPPSQSGRGFYSWCEGLSPFDIAPIEMPDWLIAVVSSQAGNETNQRVNFAAALQGFPEGERDKRLYSFASAMRSKDVPFDEALENICISANNCTPPFDTAKAEEIVTRVYKRYLPNVNYKEGVQPKPHYDHSKPEWQKPVELEIPKLPEFPTSIFPDWLERFVNELAVDTQTPPDLGGMVVLTALATAAAKKIRVASHKHTWTQATNLYGVVAIESGSRKSAVFSAVTTPIEAYELELKASVQEAVFDAQNQIKVLEWRIQKKLKEMLELPKSVQALKMPEVTAMQAEVEQLSKIRHPKIIVDDITPETLASVLCANHGRLAMLSAEADVFGMIGGRYSSGDSKLNNYVKAYDGDNMRINRQSREEIILDPALTIGVTTQPSTLQKLGGKPEFRGSGLVGRWLFALPRWERGKSNANSTPVSAITSRRYFENMLKLCKLPYRDAQLMTPHLLVLSPDVEKYFIEVCNYVEQSCGPDGPLEDLSEWGSKFAAKILRIAGLLHLAYNVQEDDPWRIPVSLRTFDQACLLIPYFISHAQAAYELLKFQEERTSAITAIRGIRKRGWTTITRTQLAALTKQKGKELDAIIILLLDYGYLRENSNGRKMYDINPYLQADAI